MAEHVTNRPGVERRGRDYRGGAVPEGLPQHLLGERVGGVLHACPECGVTLNPNPLCPVCLGDGKVSAERLDRYQVDLERQAAR